MTVLFIHAGMKDRNGTLIKHQQGRYLAKEKRIQKIFNVATKENTRE
jgi:hypothetical protein